MGMDAQATIWFGPKSREATDAEDEAVEEGKADDGISEDDLPFGVHAGSVHYDGAETVVFICSEKHRFDWDLGDETFVPKEPDFETRTALVEACKRFGFDPDTIGWHVLCNYR